MITERCLRLSVFLLTFLLISLAADDVPKREDKKSKSVNTILSAKWESTPLVLETAEYIQGESSDLFWSFVDGVNALTPSIDELGTDKEKYDTILSVTHSLLAPSQQRLLKLALSMHTASPAVRMFAEIAVQNGAKEAGCDTFVAVAGQLLCHENDIELALQNGQYDASEYKIESHQLDRHYPGSDNKSISAVLYGELGTRQFAALHRLLAQYAGTGQIDYFVRWHVKPRNKQKLRLSGYGVELQLKSTEYRSVDDSAPAEEAGSGGVGAGAGQGGDSLDDEDENDPQNQVEGFNFGRLKNLFPALRSPLERYRRHLSQASEELTPLKAWQVQALSAQAAAAVMDAAQDGDADATLRTLTSIAQDFPMQTKSLIHVNVPRELRDELQHNQEILSSQLGLRPSEALLLVSGAKFEADEVDALTLLTAMREELAPMNTLYALGLSNKMINKLLSLDMGETSTASEDYALDIRDSAITWANDLESDERYRRWPSSYMELLRPMYPGMLRNLRRNIYNFVIVIDPTSPDSYAAVKLSETLVRHATPIRVGVVLAGSTNFVRCAFNYVAQEKNSNTQALFFLSQLLETAKDREVTIDDVKSNLKKIGLSYFDDDLLSEDSEYNFGKQLAEEFVAKIGNNKLPEALVNGVPVSQERDAMASVDLLEETLVNSLSRHTSRLQRAVFQGDLADSESATDHLMQQPHVLPRLNQRILKVTTSQYLDVSGTPALKSLFSPDKIHKLMAIPSREAIATAIDNMRYFTKPPKPGKVQDTNVTQTVWVVGDLNQKKSRELLLSALTYMMDSRGVRVAFVPNVDGNVLEDKSPLNKVALAALVTEPPEKATKFVLDLLKDEGCHERKDCPILQELVPHLHQYDWVLKASRVLCVRSLNLRTAGARAVVHNGRMLGPLKEDEVFDDQDFALLERFSSQAYGDKILDVLLGKKTKKKNGMPVVETDFDDGDDDEPLPPLTGDAIFKLTSALASRTPRTRILFPAKDLRSTYSAAKLAPLRSDEPSVTVTVVLDPASPAAQRLAPLLRVLRMVVNCDITLYMNPAEKNSDVPLKSFYRYVLEPELQFTPEGALTGGPAARFRRLPSAPLLSLELRAPANWLVECVKSVYDLDNIRLADVESVVNSEFELEYLLLEGHAWDALTGAPPRGLQLTLGTLDTPHRLDTIVMANLGYFQLKANPGAWILRLRPGRSEDIYQIVEHENTDTPVDSKDIQVVISSFRSHVLKLRVSKRAGKQNEDLLSDPDDQQSGIWNSIASSFGGGDEKTEEDDTINIFSVASGHLYERFLRIMMMSVLKNTKSPVKFWFLKNYLSPSLMDILPYMSREFGFQYELVQYQWPRWLQTQRDRQRTIWGYKILFLDVLFPLHVRKIIFVDADQIVRADLKELVDLDLGGAPYGYTPFCDSRTEMEGFRFWKTGYWRNHLQGRRYHISALYVVDLRRFRRIAAGDRLRGQYQALSQDPNSLSNLDQDLPNNMIHQVSIKSLPQEWLWCETWCDERSKASAKTIDLCNNPLTKEAKLSAAMRIVPEWRSYDQEIKELAARVRTGLYQAGDQDPETLLHDQHEVPEDIQTSEKSDQMKDGVKTNDVHSEL